MSIRKLTPWTPEEVSVVYWLVLWGLRNMDIVELASPVLTKRSPDGIGWMAVEVRKQVSIIRGFPVNIPPYSTIPVLVRKASKLEPHKEIVTLRPSDLAEVKFIPSLSKGPTTKPIKVSKPNFQQTDVNEPRGISDKLTESDISKMHGRFSKIDDKKFEEAKNLIKEEYSLEEVLIIAKKVGAIKVHYKDYIIKFV